VDVTPFVARKYPGHIDLDLRFLKNWLGRSSIRPSHFWQILQRMELLLNLAWILLALPAYWLWRSRAARGPREQAFTALQCLLALGCVLILLFPVISATDDLHAMRCEVEEPGTNKRAVRSAGSDKNSAWVNGLRAPLAIVTGTAWLAAPETALHEVLAIRLAPLAAPRVFHTGRAPPSSFLG